MFPPSTNHPQGFSQGKVPLSNVNLFTQPFTPNILRPSYNNYTSHNTNSTTSTLEDNLLGGMGEAISLRKNSSVMTNSRPPLINLEDRRKSFTSGENEGFRESILSRSNKTQPIKTYNKFNIATSSMENTEILNVKFNFDGVKVLRINRFDDVVNTVKLFCDKNKIPEYLLKSVVISISQALDNIYKIYNYRVGKIDEEYMNSLYKLWGSCKDTKKQTNEEKVELDITSISNISLPMDSSDEDLLNNFSILNNSF